MPYFEPKMVAYIGETHEAVRKTIWRKIGDIDMRYYRTKEPVTFAERFEGEEHTGIVGQSWGELFDCAWFRFTGTLPAAAAGKKVALIIDISGEMYIADAQGNPIRGLTTTQQPTPGAGKTELLWSENGVAGETIDFWADAGCNNLVGQHFGGLIRCAYIAEVNDAAKKLFYDWAILQDLMKSLPENSARRAALMFGLNDAANALKYLTPDEIERADAILAPLLAARSDNHALSISCICHAHMDLAWLWPLRETVRKGGRTFATVCRTMEKYPDYRFGASQAQLYQWVKDRYPTVFADVKNLVAERRFEPHGGMWVEPDGNMPSGESFARQALYGKQFFQREFGFDVEVAWLPDTFGFSAQLPQIFKKAGINYFISARAVINSQDRTHHTFWWEGLDGSRVLAHVLPEGEHYSSPGTPSTMLKIEADYADKGLCDRTLVSVGMGDGGGGPGEEHMERLNRQRSLEGLPPVTQEFAVDFFRHIEKNGDCYPAWVGELMLNICQGTFSSQARMKSGNRKMEAALRELEFASIQALPNLPYASTEIEALWKETLLLQFHDILPGTAIERVHSEATERYEIMLAQTKSLIEKTYRAFLSSEPGVTAINSLSWERAEWVQHEGKWGRAVIPAFGSATVSFGAVDTLNLAASEMGLSNELLRLTFNADGSIASVFDIEHTREVLSGDANKLEFYADYGDGWRIASNYREKGAERFELQSCTFGVDGPVAWRKCVYGFKSSTVTQEIRLTAGSRRVDFITQAEMNDQKIMVRTSFPTTIKTPVASCETAFGHVQRPVHQNTAADVIRYEVCAHRWADFSDKGYGVALLNDSKYGHSIQDRTLGLTLLRTTNYPGENADLGAHEFTYALYPHAGDCTNGVIQEAYALNNPLQVFPLAQGEQMAPLISTDQPNIIIDAVKKAEDSDALIFRLYEAYGMETRAQISGASGKTSLVNLLEAETGDESLSENGILHFDPFEIHTLRAASQNVEKGHIST